MNRVSLSDTFYSLLSKIYIKINFRLYEFLTTNGLSVWKDDQGGMGGNMFEDMKNGIDSAQGVFYI